jgi:hypothetical protein
VLVFEPSLGCSFCASFSLTLTYQPQLSLACLKHAQTSTAGTSACSWTKSSHTKPTLQRSVEYLILYWIWYQKWKTEWLPGGAYVLYFLQKLSSFAWSHRDGRHWPELATHLAKLLWNPGLLGSGSFGQDPVNRSQFVRPGPCRLPRLYHLFLVHFPLQVKPAWCTWKTKFLFQENISWTLEQGC